MELNTDFTFDKKKRLLTMVTPKDDFLRLFFQARNNAIEAACARIKTYLWADGFNADVCWKESSRSAYIKITLHENKRTHERTVFLHRDTVNAANSSLVSQCVYELKRIQDGEYYPHKKPKEAVRFDAVLGGKEFFDFVAGNVNGVNYPFYYQSFSSY